ncbi:hypothetical protein BYT27DRAFT_7032784, partial [Phlegmacium glaucopus]
LNHFENDASHIGTRYLLHLIHREGHDSSSQTFTHKGLGTTHILSLLPNDQYVCDCCMGMNLGIPCWHYFQALSVVRNLHFILGVIRP